MKPDKKIAVVIPNLNGEDYLEDAITSLLSQTTASQLIIVDNASSDRSLSIIEKYSEQCVLIKNVENLGFTGGVNAGIEYAIQNSFDLVALFNNDAVADKDWLRSLVMMMDDTVGIATGRLESIDKSFIDSTGEQMSDWGLAYPRGRGMKNSQGVFDRQEFVFGATGGASIYSIHMLQEIGLFDQHFFAYFEDVDISFRAQLAGWKVRYTPDAIAYHRISQTTKRMYKGFSTYHTFKNLPLLLHKNLPLSLRRYVLPRFWLGYWLYFSNAVLKGAGWHAFRGLRDYNIYKKRLSRSPQSVSDSYIKSILSPGPPPGSRGLTLIYKLMRGGIR